jgi:hypothetical protein
MASAIHAIGQCQDVQFIAHSVKFILHSVLLALEPRPPFP